MKERKRRGKAKRYAAQFYEELQQQNDNLFNNCTRPNIICCRRFKEDPEEPGETLGGETTRDGKTIYIYGIAKQRPQILKKIIRHEMIHALLAQKEIPANDTDAIFIIFALVYDAAPYELYNKNPEQTERLIKALINEDRGTIDNFIETDFIRRELNKREEQEAAFNSTTLEPTERSATK